MTCEGEEELGRAVLHSHRRKLFERVRPGCVHVHVACHVMLEMSCPCHLCEMGMGICMLHVHRCMCPVRMCGSYELGDIRCEVRVGKFTSRLSILQRSLEPFRSRTPA